MNTTAIRALIRNDIRLYFSDRRSVIVGVLVPICIAAFFGYLTKMVEVSSAKKEVSWMQGTIE